MEEVASSPTSDHYFYAPDGDTLEEIFQKIGTKLSSVYLSQ